MLEWEKKVVIKGKKKKTVWEILCKCKVSSIWEFIANEHFPLTEEDMKGGKGF